MKITLYKKIYDKEQFSNVIDNSFKELKTEPDLQFFDVNLATIDDFFTLYEKFFYEIPKEGERSHTYLAQTSSEYANADLINETILALTEEINTLREENVKLLPSITQFEEAIPNRE